MNNAINNTLIEHD